MIRFINQGGLGNQLFIWTAAHYYEELFDDKVVIYFGPAHSKSDLASSTIAPLVEFCTHNIEVKTRNTLSIHLLLKFFDKFSFYSPNLFRRFKLFLRIIDVENPVALPVQMKFKPKVIRGFFQSGEMVWEMRATVSNEIISWTKTFTSTIDKLKSNLGIDRYQAMHVRRGDYLENQDQYGLLKASYYKKNSLKNDICLITSDSDEVMEYMMMVIPDSKFLSPSIYNPWETFSILSKARHLITANSTFSWWAGLIVLIHGGTVVSPKPWFKSIEIDSDYLNIPGLTFSVSEF